MLHPRVATVTYLSDAGVGVPTLILDKRSPPPSDLEKKSLNGSVNKGWLSHPSFGKHIAFDGRLLHGGPGEYFPAVTTKLVNPPEEPKAKKLKVEEIATDLSGKRITFMVNIWLNHCPLESEPLEDDLVDQLSTRWEGVNEDVNAQSNLKVGEPNTPPFQWNITDISAFDEVYVAAPLVKAPKESPGAAGEEDCILCNRHVAMKFGATKQAFHYVSDSARGKGSASIPMEDGALTLQVGEEVSSDDENDDE